MKAAHTPGPWEATEFNEIRCVKNGYIVANVPSVDRRVRGKQAAEERAGIEANKALLSAAPDLLAVAQLLALATEEGDDAAQGTHYIRDGRIYCKGSFLDAIERARTAIAKATGSAA